MSGADSDEKTNFENKARSEIRHRDLSRIGQHKFLDTV